MNNIKDKDYLYEKAHAFLTSKQEIDIIEIKTGFINNTYLVTPFKEKDFAPFVLQRINSTIFTEPENIISNYLLLEKSIFSQRIGQSREHFLKIPKLLKSSSNSFLVTFPDGKWRSFEYIDSTITYEVASSKLITFKIARTLAIFHQLTNKIKSEYLSKTIHNFHNTPYYLREYDQELENYISINNINKSFQINNIIDFIENNREEALLLTKPIDNNILLETTIHGDPKVSNFLFNNINQDVVALIDLDTCNPGPVLFDLADCIRSSCNPIGEDPLDNENVLFNIDFYEYFLLGYFSLPKTLLSKSDIFYLPYSIRLITFELSVRFITDYFKGNIYFDIKDENQNLRRAFAQYKLHASIMSNWDEIIILTNKICKSSF